MKSLISLLSVLLIFSCSGYRSFGSFYDSHKEDPNVTAVQMPRFLISTLSNLDPTMKDLFGNVKEFRFLQLNHNNNYEVSKINNEVSALTSTNFTEIFRKNVDKDRTVLSVRERKDVVKEILFYNNTIGSSNFLYLKGDFNPEKVRKYANEGKFDSIASQLKKPKMMSDMMKVD